MILEVETRFVGRYWRERCCSV